MFEFLKADLQGLRTKATYITVIEVGGSKGKAKKNMKMVKPIILLNQ